MAFELAELSLDEEGVLRIFGHAADGRGPELAVGGSAVSLAEGALISPDGTLIRRMPSATSMSAASSSNGVDMNSMPAAAQRATSASCSASPHRPAPTLKAAGN